MDPLVKYLNLDLLVEKECSSLLKYIFLTCWPYTYVPFFPKYVSDGWCFVVKFSFRKDSHGKRAIDYVKKECLQALAREQF